MSAVADLAFDSTLSIVGGVAVAYAIFHLMVWLNRLANPNLPDCAGGAQFPLGSLASWRDLLQANRNILDETSRNGPSRRAGGVLAQWTFFSQSVAVVSARHVDAVLRSSVSRAMRPNFLNTVGLRHFKQFFGPRSVGVTEGNVWAAGRKAIGRSLKPAYIRSLHSKLASCTDAAADILEQRAASAATRTIDVAPVFHALALDVVCEAIFGEPAGALQAERDGRSDPIVKAFRVAEDEMVRRTASANPLDWLYLRGIGRFYEPQRALDAANLVIRRFIRDPISRRLKSGVKSTDDDLLHHMLREPALALPKGQHQSTTSGAVVDNVVTMVWAGHDTTAAALSFATMLLAEHTVVQDDLRAELDSLAEADDAGELSGAGVRQAPLLNAVMLETLRLYPPTLWTNRGIQKEVVLDPADGGGEGERITLSKGSCAFLPIWAIHRSPLNWDKPNEFIPARFMPGNIIVPGSMVPFGAGRRQCPGYGLSPFEIKVALSRLVRRFKFATPHDMPRPEIKAHGMVQQCLNNYVIVTTA